MEKDYIKLYQDTYLEEEVNYEILILNKVKEYKKNKRNYNFCSNNILNEYRIKEKEFRVLKTPYDNLFYLYKRRADEFEPEHYMEVIPQTLQPKFKKIIHKDENYTFELFIKELAKVNASSNCYRIFSNNYNLFDIMFQLNRFEEFKLDESLGNQNSAFYEKYRVMLHPDRESFDSQINLDVNETLKSQKFTNFKIANKELLETDDYYYSLTNHFISEENTSFEDFKNVLLNDFESHTSEICFFCSNFLIRRLVLSFKEKFGGEFNLSTAEKSKKFRNHGGNYINAQSLSHAIIDKKNALTDEIKEILK